MSMKNIFIIIILVVCTNLYGQSEAAKEKIRQLNSDIWLDIWDKENSEAKLKINRLSYDDIPKYLEFRGTVVEALRWTDKVSEKILIQTVTGGFDWKDYDDSNNYMIQDKAELYVYLFEKQNDEDTFSPSWRIYDYTECFGVDMYTGFIPEATTITDIDNNGITEIAIPYVLICRGGMDPGVMKIIMYENEVKYALRGSTSICKGKPAYGGEKTPSENLKSNKLFLEFLNERWHIHTCERDRFY